jgi:hypothetical protein
MSAFKKGLTSVTDGLGLTDSGAGDRAYEAQAAAMAEANRLQKQIYDESKERYKPWQEEGVNSFKNLARLANNRQDFQDAEGVYKGHSGTFSLADFQQDPGYNFRMKEGQKALQRSASARGNMGGGGTMKALARYGQDYASGEYQNAYNRFNQDYGNAYNRYNNNYDQRFNGLNTIANYGSNANNSLSGLGTNYANAVSGNITSLGNARAANEMNRGNSLKDVWKMGIQATGMALGAGGGMMPGGEGMMGGGGAVGRSSIPIEPM